MTYFGTLYFMFLFFTGNGFLGLSLDGNTASFFSLDRLNPIEIPFVPVVDIMIKELATRHEQMLAVNLVEGTIHRLIGYQVVSKVG